MEIMKVLIESISQYFQLSSREKTKCAPIQKYYEKAEEILKLLTPLLDAIVNAELAPNEKLEMALFTTIQSVGELREIFENWQPLMSKVYLVIQADSLITKIQVSSLEIVELLQSFEQCLPPELSVASLAHILQMMKHIEHEQTSEIVTIAIKDQLEGSGTTSESMAKMADCLSLKSNQELLIEAVALENLKENLGRDEKNEEVDYIDQILALVIEMHERLVMLKQSQTFSPVTIPAEFCCPLSLEVMTDPVIVDSGQTYERAFIQQWINLGLKVCPKTRQPLARTNLIPNYTVKGWITNWCESNNVKLPDPIESMSFNQPSSLLGHVDSGPPRDSHVSSHSKGSQSTLPDSSLTLGPPIASDRPQIERQSSHSHNSSDDSMPVAMENGHELDHENMSLRGHYDVRSSDLSSPLFASSRSGSIMVHIHPSEGHDQAASTSSTISISRASQFAANNRDEASTSAAVEANFAPREFTSQPRIAATLTMPEREPGLPFWLERQTRNHKIWHRSSDRLVPRVVQSSEVETRHDLSEVEVQVKNLVEDLKSTSLDTQRNASAELRQLARHNMENRVVIADCGAIDLLVNLLRSTDSEIQENAVTALLNLSINVNNKSAIANTDAIALLIHVLQTGSTEAKENSAATLFSLSVYGDNKVKIGRAGAIKPLVDLLGNGTPRGKKDAATALFNLSLFHENKAQIVQAGAVKFLIDLMDSAAGMIDKAVAVLSNLSTIDEGRQEIGLQGGIPLLVEVVELGSSRSKENAAAALLQLCNTNSKFCNMVLQEDAVPPLMALLHSGSARAREKAQALLRQFRNQQHGRAGRA